MELVDITPSASEIFGYCDIDADIDVSINSSPTAKIITVTDPTNPLAVHSVDNVQSPVAVEGSSRCSNFKSDMYEVLVTLGIVYTVAIVLGVIIGSIAAGSSFIKYGDEAGYVYPWSRTYVMWQSMGFASVHWYLVAKYLIRDSIACWAVVFNISVQYVLLGALSIANVPFSFYNLELANWACFITLVIFLGVRGRRHRNIRRPMLTLTVFPLSAYAAGAVYSVVLPTIMNWSGPKKLIFVVVVHPVVWDIFCSTLYRMSVFNIIGSKGKDAAYAVAYLCYLQFTSVALRRMIFSSTKTVTEIVIATLASGVYEVVIRVFLHGSAQRFNSIFRRILRDKAETTPRHEDHSIHPLIITCHMVIENIHTISLMFVQYFYFKQRFFFLFGSTADTSVSTSSIFISAAIQLGVEILVDGLCIYIEFTRYKVNIRSAIRELRNNKRLLAWLLMLSYFSLTFCFHALQNIPNILFCKEARLCTCSGFEGVCSNGVLPPT